MKEMELLILSDVHFGPSSSSAEFALEDAPPHPPLTGAVSMKKSLVDALAGREVSAVLVCGDLTSRGRPSEFAGCEKTILEVASDIGVPSNDVFFAFGNHDVDRRISGLADVGTGQADTRYYSVAASVGDMFVKNRTLSAEGPLPGCATFKRDGFTLLSLNTGYFCNGDQAYAHGVLGQAQLTWLRSALGGPKPSGWSILMLHHHPRKYPYPTPTEDISCLQEGPEFMDAMQYGHVDIVCHGHRHHPYLCTQMENGWARPVTFLCAGSLAAGASARRLGEIPNVFHVLRLEQKAKNGAAVGTVQTFRYTSSEGWLPVSYSSEVPFDAVQKFGSIATSSELLADVERLITEATAGGHNTFLRLPGYDTLPLSLKCVPLRKLNDLLRQVAKENANMGPVGQYPDDVYLRKH